MRRDARGVSHAEEADLDFDAYMRFIEGVLAHGAPIKLPLSAMVRAGGR
jgi:hypothetical protein